MNGLKFLSNVQTTVQICLGSLDATSRATSTVCCRVLGLGFLKGFCAVATPALRDVPVSVTSLLGWDGAPTEGEEGSPGTETDEPGMNSKSTRESRVVFTVKDNIMLSTKVYLKHQPRQGKGVYSR